MREFIEELKQNKYECVRVDYVIERLEDIRANLLENIEYFDFHNKNLNRTQDEKIDNIKENLTSKGVFE